MVPEHQSLEERFLELLGEDMNPTLAIAALTIREAVRRRIRAGLRRHHASASSALSAWGFYRLSHGQASPRARSTWRSPSR